MRTDRTGALRVCERGLGRVAVLAVFTIVALNLLGVTLPWVDTARRDRARLLMAVIADALEIHRARHGAYPTTARGLLELFGPRHSD